MPEIALLRNRLFSKLSLLVSLLALVLVFAFALPVQSSPMEQNARQFQTGDIVVSINNGDVLWYDSNGNFIESIFQGSGNWLAGLAFNPDDQLLYVTDQSVIWLFDIFATRIGTFGSGYDETTSIVFDGLGNAYVGQITSAGNPLIKLSPSGNFNKGFSLNSSSYEGVMGAVLASDQCTFYYTSYAEEGQSVRRFDICQNLPITPGLTSGLNHTSSAIGLQLLPDGSLLVANSGDIRRINSSTGNFIQSYDYPGEDYWTDLALSPDGATFWSAAGTRIYKFNVTNGAQIGFFDAGADTNFSQSNQISGITVIGEYQAAQPTPTFTPSVTASSTFTNTPTITLTFTATPTRTPTGTQTDLPTNTPTVTPSHTLVPTETRTPTEEYLPTLPPQSPSAPWWPDIIIALTGGGILAGGTYVTVRALKSKPRAQREQGSYQTRVQIRVHEDAGNHVVETQSGMSLPKIQLRVGVGQVDLYIEENRPRRTDGGTP